MGLHSIGPSSPQHYRIAEPLEGVGGIQCQVVLLYSSSRGQPDFLKKIIIQKFVILAFQLFMILHSIRTTIENSQLSKLKRWISNSRIDLILLRIRILDLHWKNKWIRIKVMNIS